MSAYNHYRFLWRSVLFKAMFISVTLCMAVGGHGAYGAELQPSPKQVSEKATTIIDNNNSRAPLVLKTLTVNYLDVEQLAAQLASFVPAPGTIAIVNHQLVINSSASNIAEIESLLQQLDTPPEQLLLSVRFNAPQALTATGAKGNGRHYQTLAAQHPAMQVRTQARQPTAIAQHQRQTQLIPSGWGGFHSEQRRKQSDELYATVELQGQQANIELSTLQHQGDALEQNLYDIKTRISGPLGQWLAVNPSVPNNTRANTKRYQISPTKGTIYIKVERLEN